MIPNQPPPVNPPASPASASGSSLLPFRAWLQLESSANELGDVSTRIVGDIHVHDAGAASVLPVAGRRDEPSALCRRKVAYGDLLGHGYPFAVVRERGEGKVRKGEYRAAHDSAEGVPVARRNRQRRHGVFAVQLVERDSVLGGEPVLREIGASLVYGPERSPLYCPLFSGFSAGLSRNSIAYPRYRRAARATLQARPRSADGRRAAAARASRTTSASDISLMPHSRR